MGRLTPLEILAQVVCGIIHGTMKDDCNAGVLMQNDNVINEKKEEYLVPLPPKKQSYVYFNFLNDRSGPSNSNGMPSTAKERNGSLIMRGEKEILEEEQRHLAPIRKRSQCCIQQVPNLVEECYLHYPKKPRSTSSSPIRQNSSPASTENNNALKRRFDDNDHHDDQEWAVDDPNKQKLKKIKFSNNNNDKKNNRNMKMKRVINNNKGKKIKISNDNLPTPDLPEEFKNLILGDMNGTELQLLMQKSLSKSDIKRDQGRLLLPRLQTSSKTFLRSNEITMLNAAIMDKKSQTIPFTVPLIDPKLQQTEITLGSWKMSGQENQYSFVLKSTWNDVVEENQLQVSDVVQVWSFRANQNDDVNDNDDQLYFALVLVMRGEPIGEEESSSTVSSNGCDQDLSSS